MSEFNLKVGFLKLLLAELHGAIIRELKQKHKHSTSGKSDLKTQRTTMEAELGTYPLQPTF